MRHLFPSILLVIVSFATAHGLNCHEGFNASVGGIPFYHWADRECRDKSKCFTQELEAKVMETNLGVNVRYGGCISTFYSSLVTCENLFGPRSTLDPAILLNMIPDLDGKFKAIGNDFAKNMSENLRLLLSGGKGSDEFVDGVFRFFDNLGFNTEKAIPMKPHLVKGLNALVLVPETYEDFVDVSKIRTEAGNDLLVAIGKLDTTNLDFAAQLYSFLGNFLGPEQITSLKSSPQTAPLIEQIPGLVKSMFPSSWNVDWYDVMLELVGDVRISSPKQSAIDVVKTMKKAMPIPEEYDQFLDPIFDTAPDLVEQMALGNYTYASTWSAELLKAESSISPVTKRLSNAITKFAAALAPDGLPYDVHVAITWLPGLFYGFFPSNTSDIDEIYNTLADGFESIDWRDPLTTLPPTKLSDFVVFITDKLFLQGPDPQQIKAMKDLLIINFSRTVYNLMPDYNDQMDIIFTTMSDGFKNFPNFDSGKIIADTITNLGWTVPPEINPLLNNLQALLGAYNLSYFDYNIFRTEAIKIINEYKEAYPNSDLPDLGERYLDYYNRLLFEVPQYPDCSLGDGAEYNWTLWEQCYEDFNTKLQTFTMESMKISTHLSIDTTFAVFREIDVDGNSMYKLLYDSFPGFDIYISLMRALQPDDLKQLYDDLMTYLMANSEPGKYPTVEGFVNAVNGTFFKITSRLGDVTKELRKLFAPNSCKYVACDQDFCNSHVAIDTAIPVTKDPEIRRQGGEVTSRKTPIGKDEKEAVTATPITTTSGSEKAAATILLNLATLWLGYKVTLG